MIQTIIRNLKNKSILYILILIIVILSTFIIIKFTNIFCDIGCNETKMDNIKQCAKDMYRARGDSDSFTTKQKNDYMKICISTYEQYQAKEKKEEKDLPATEPVNKWRKYKL
ncbi:MAG: hypothetical protein O2916_11875 [Proteobacteria bacterium]|nr:hypothetical protein [Pseudomonadota bacterium]